jgi:hypothetical protein
MKQGVAFLHGISMFGKNNYSKNTILRCLKQIETNTLQILGMFGNDNVIFETSDDTQYATIGSMIERSLSETFDHPFTVTTRSLGTITSIVRHFVGVQ